MKEMKIALVKLYNGDFIIGECDETTMTVHILCMQNPRQLMMMPIMTESISGMVLKPICFPFRCERLKDRISIDISQILFIMWEDEIDTDVVNGYKSEVSGIKIANAAEAASITSTSKASSPKEFII